MVDSLARLQFFFKYILISTIIHIFFSGNHRICCEKISPKISHIDRGERYANISCQTKKSEHSLYLFCPLISDTYCFQNCRQSCGSQNNCPNFDAFENIKNNCSYDIMNGDVRTSYLVDTYDYRNSGEWYCTYAGATSSKVNIILQKPPSTSSSTTTLTTPTVKPSVVTNSTRSPYGKLDEKPGSQQGSFKKTNTSTTCQKPTQIVVHPLGKMEYILSLLFVLLLSLMINIAFCTRCLLVRCYLDRRVPKKPHRSSRACLDCCLCLRLNENERRNTSSPQHVDGPLSTLLNPIDRNYFVESQIPLQADSNQSPATLPFPAIPYQPIPINYMLTERIRRSSGAPSCHRNSMPAALVRSRTFPVPPAFPQQQQPHPIQGIIYASSNGSAALTPVAIVTGPNSNHLLQQHQLSPSSESQPGALRASQLLYDEVPHAGSDHLENSTAGSNPLPMRGSTSLSSLPPRVRGGSIQLPHPILPQRAAGTSVHSSSPHQRPCDVETDAYSYRSEATGSENASSYAAQATDSAARLEMSRNLLRKADTLLREADSLLTSDNRAHCNA